VHPIRLTITGALLTILASVYVADVPVLWSLAIFSVLSLLTARASLVIAMLIPFAALVLIANAFAYARLGAFPTLEFMASQMHAPYVLMFSYVFLPGIYLSTQIDVYELLPRRASRASVFRTARFVTIQLIHRRSALIRRTGEIFEALALRGIDIQSAHERVRYSYLWVPTLASTAFVEALEAIEYERMMKFDLGNYSGVFRRSPGSRWHAFLLDVVNILLLLAAVRHVLIAH
jgi:hypothetical protein